MISDAILNARQAIRKDFSSYDNSFKIKKMKIISILNDIDNNTSIEDSEITRKFNIWYNLAMLYAKRVSPSLVNWLNNARFTISECLEIYKSTYSTVYKVDDTFKDWWFNQPHKKDMELHYTWFNEKEPVLLEYSGVVFGLLIMYNILVMTLPNWVAVKASYKVLFDSEPCSFVPMHIEGSYDRATITYNFNFKPSSYS